MKNTTAILIGFFSSSPSYSPHDTVAVRIVAMSICTIGIALFVYGIEKEFRKNDKRR